MCCIESVNRIRFGFECTVNRLQKFVLVAALSETGRELLLHINVGSLSHYATASVDQQRAMADILNRSTSASANAIQPQNVPSAAIESQPQVSQQIAPLPRGPVTPVIAGPNPNMPSPSNTASAHQQLARYDGTFAGVVFHGNVTINYSGINPQ